MAGLALASPPGLPPGVRQSDCDRPADALDSLGGAQLWNACNFAQQEAICSRFVSERSDVLRDALLDDRISLLAGAAARLGAVVLPQWFVFRDDLLREMVCRGEINLRG
jgi:hypothetical protein